MDENGDGFVTHNEAIKFFKCGIKWEIITNEDAAMAFKYMAKHIGADKKLN